MKLQCKLSRKGSGCEKKMNSNADNEKGTCPSVYLGYVSPQTKQQTSITYLLFSYVSSLPLCILAHKNEVHN